MASCAIYGLSLNEAFVQNLQQWDDGDVAVRAYMLHFLGERVAAAKERGPVLRIEPCTTLSEVLLVITALPRSLPEPKTASDERHEQQRRAGEQALPKRRAGLPHLP